MPYDPRMIQPFRDELTQAGFTELHTAAEVDASVAQKGTTMVIVNSVCGCAAGQARPGAMLALQNAKIPDRSVTVFAGVDRDAVNRAREHMSEYPPSSPCMGRFKDGKLVFMLQRLDLQQMNEDQVATALREAFDQHCAGKGPSISAEEFQKIRPYQGCGSGIPLLGQRA